MVDYGKALELGVTPEVIERTRELVARGALFVCNNSGGKDSQAMAILLAMMVPADQILNLHASLGEDGTDEEGVEWPDTWGHVQYMGEALGLETRVCAAEKTFFGMVRTSAERMKANGTYENGSPWPSPKYRQCTSDLKRGPLTKAIRAYVRETNHNGIIVNCMGLRAEESSQRAKKVTWARNKKMEAKTERGAFQEWYEWLPIHDWLVEKVFEVILSAGQRPHWAYEKGMKRLSCCFCIMASKEDLSLAAELRPELYAKVVRMERELGKSFTMGGKNLDEVTGIPVPEDGKVHLAVVAG
jgi:DNA sulfur modification protein DndC